MSRTKELTKDHIGKRIFGLRSGVNVRSEQQLVEYDVMGVAIRYATISEVGANAFQKRVCRTTGTDERSIRTGHTGERILWFKSREDYEYFKEFKAVRRKVNDFFNGYNMIENFSDESVSQILSIIDKERNV